MVWPQSINAMHDFGAVQIIAKLTVRALASAQGSQIHIPNLCFRWPHRSSDFDY